MEERLGIHMKMRDFCVIVVCSFVGVDEHSIDAYCLHHQGDE
jgi:hypothetical protein